MTESESTHFWKNVDLLKKDIKKLYEQKQAELKKFYKTREGKKQLKKEKNYKWWGFNFPEGFKKFKNKDNKWLDEMIHWRQYDKNKHQLPIIKNKSRYIRLNQTDYKSIGKVSKTTYHYGRLKIKDPKFNGNLPLNKPQTDSKNNEFHGDVKWVELGDIDDDDADSNVELYNLFRAIKIPIDRQPYVPDFSFKIGEMHNTGLRLYIRCLLYGIGCVVKCNVILNPNQKDQRKLMIKDNEKHWYETKQLSKDSLFDLFFNQYGSSHNLAKHVCKINFIDDMIEFLVKNKNMNVNSHWLLSANTVIDFNDGYKSLLSFLGVWRHPGDGRDEEEESNDKYMFDLLNYIHCNEGLCTIKCIQVVASRIATILASATEERRDDDGLTIVQCIELILQLCKKGDISAWHEAFMPLPGYILNYDKEEHLKTALNKLHVSTTVIQEALRVIGDLGAFDFNYVITHNKLHKIWFVYFMWALIALLNNLAIYQATLPPIMKHIYSVSQHSRFCMYIALTTILVFV